MGSTPLRPPSSEPLAGASALGSHGFWVPEGRKETAPFSHKLNDLTFPFRASGTKHHTLGGLTQQKSYSYGGKKSNTNVSAGPCSL